MKTTIAHNQPLVVSIVIIIVIITTVYVVYVNWYNPIILLISLTILISVFDFSYSHLKEKEEQKNLIISLQRELKIVGRHYKWYKDNISEKKLPDHGIYKINPAFYIRKLKPEINNVPTESLMLSLSLLVDKIWLINYYITILRRRYIKTFVDKETKETTLRKIENTLKDLEKFLEDTREECNSILK